MLLGFVMEAPFVVCEVRAEAEGVDDLETATEADCMLYGNLAEPDEQLTI
jgi:hypothetical protein